MLLLTNSNTILMHSYVYHRHRCHHIRINACVSTPPGWSIWTIMDSTLSAENSGDTRRRMCQCVLGGRLALPCVPKNEQLLVVIL